MNKMNHKMRGIMLAITGAIFWGGSGVCAEYIMQTKGISSSWLVSVRMLSAGTIILSYLFAKDGKKAFDLLRTRKNRLNILVFSLVGVVLLQFSFLKQLSLAMQQQQPYYNIYHLFL